MKISDESILFRFKSRYLNIFVFLFLTVKVKGQQIHAHNDYVHSTPFFASYCSGAKSIEVDVFLQNGRLMVGHTLAELDSSKTLSSLYLKRLNAEILDLGRFQLMIDIKSEAESTLKAVIWKIEQYESIKLALNDGSKKIIISGNRPADYKNWPDYIYFDHQKLEVHKNPEKIAQYSFSFRTFSKWDGIGKLPRKDKLKLEKINLDIHNLKKPIRFWATPDTPKAWLQLSKLKVDWLSTDLPKTCAMVLRKKTPQYSLFF